MAALENKVTLQRSPEASFKCFQPHGFHQNLQSNMNVATVASELKDELCSHPGEVVEPAQQISNGFLEHANKFYSKPTIVHDFGGWLAFYPEPTKMQQYQMDAYGNQYFPVTVEPQLQYAPYNVRAQGYPYNFQVQDFQYFVVIDFEATCDKERNPHPQEIIEFPSVIVNSVTGQLEACFQTYVKPTCNQLLSDFCKDLTGIQQIQVDRGVTLSEALLRHDKWLEKKGIKNTNFVVVTWSNWDCRVMLESECRFKKIRKPPYFNSWINLKVPFREVFGGVNCNLREAVEMAGLVWQGRAHSGLDDAKNTARLLSFLMHRGFKFSITNSLMWHTADILLGSNQLPGTVPPSYNTHKPKDIQVPVVQYQPFCFCGVRSTRGTVRKPGPKQGSIFFGCGNWTATRGARCHYFEWASA